MGGVVTIRRILAVGWSSLVVNRGVKLIIEVLIIHLASSHKLSHIYLKWEIDEFLNFVSTLHSFNREYHDGSNLDNLLSLTN